MKDITLNYDHREEDGANQLTTSYSIDVTVIPHKFGQSKFEIKVQKFILEQKRGKLKWVNSDKPQFYNYPENVNKYCTFKEIRADKREILPAVAAFLKDIARNDSTKKPLSRASMKKVLQAIPSCFLRSEDIFEAYKALLKKELGMIEESARESDSFRPKKIAKKTRQERLKDYNDIVLPKLNNLRKYFNSCNELDRELLVDKPAWTAHEEKIINDTLKF